MRYREVGRTGVKVSEVGFGCWTLGGPNWSSANGQPIGWADVNETDVLAGIRAGLDAGVNHWDNADVYGNGRAERTLGAALKKLGASRDRQVIATKVGHFKGTAPHGYDPAHIRNQCDQSLRNLGVDYIDIYYFHHAAFVGQGYDGGSKDYLHEAAGVMRDLVEAGKVRAVGQSGYGEDDFERVVPVVKPDVLQAKANLRFDGSLRPGSRMQRLMDAHGCSFVAFGPLDQGILLDKFDPDRPPAWEQGDYRASRKDFNPRTLREVRDKLALVKERFGPAADPTRLLSSVAQRWVLAHRNVCSTIPGFRDAKQAGMNVAAAEDPPLSEADVAWLRRLFHGDAA
ncbi:MAG TPA: aldo/keto reductase [Phycisphaerales bacterium]|nr:aldo/keto reductase [Phycisphaerales bacterium]